MRACTCRRLQVLTLCALTLVCTNILADEIPITTSSDEARQLYLKARDFNEKLRFGVLIVLGFPLLAAINIYFVLRVMDIFDRGPDTGVITVAAFAFVIGIAAIGADIWLLRWLNEEINIFRWIRSSEEDE